MQNRYFIYLSYKGTKYHGWQVQPNGISVQEVLTNALRTVLRDNSIEIIGAGRTDTGVHAKMMVAHLDFHNLPDKENFIYKMNSLLPNDISICDVRKVKKNAHARFDALSRRYEYHIVKDKNVFKTESATRIGFDLDFDLMNNAAESLKKYTDFTSFSKLHTDVHTNNCSISYAKWTKDKDEWIFTIEADRFLRNMVRAIVGTLFEVGKKKITKLDFEKIIEEKNRSKAGTSVPAQGLYLVDVKYPESIFVND